MATNTPKRTDADLKAELLRLAKAGAPRPAANTELGRALTRFTTSPEREVIEAAHKVFGRAKRRGSLPSLASNDPQERTDARWLNQVRIAKQECHNQQGH